MALVLLPALLAGSAAVQAVDSDLYLAGLGLHQETGRNIYLGGIYLEREAPRPQNLAEAPGTRVMEYRVVARRTSIRSLLGGMLLQSEVATGHPPDQATAEFADMILSAVSNSLYAGDSLKIVLDSNDVTIALLNGHELARVNNAEVADYMLMGWVGESGPSTTFRNNITGGEVDPSLLSALEANTYSAQREKEIAQLLGTTAAVQAPAPEVVAVVEAPAAIVEEPAPTAVEPAPEAPVDEAPGGAAPEAEQVAAAPAAALTPVLAPVAVHATSREVHEFPVQPAVEEVRAETQPQNVQVASLLPTAGVSALESEIRNLGVQEYSQRLLAFHGEMVRMVYGEIRYPKRAVRRSLEGRLELDVTLDAEGQVLAIEVAQGSGHKLLDDAAVNAAEDAFKRGVDKVDPVAIAEFGDFGSRQLTVPVPVSFRLQ